MTFCYGAASPSRRTGNCPLDRRSRAETFCSALVQGRGGAECSEQGGTRAIILGCTLCTRAVGRPRVASPRPLGAQGGGAHAPGARWREGRRPAAGPRSLSASPRRMAIKPIPSPRPIARLNPARSRAAVARSAQAKDAPAGREVYKRRALAQLCTRVEQLAFSSSRLLRQ